MEHFVRIVMEKQEDANKLDESIFAEQTIYETDQNTTVYEFALPRLLEEHEADEYAQKLADYMFENGFEDFDIEISTDDEVADDEITYENDDEFFEDYGIMWFNEDDDIDEAEYQGRKVKLGKPMQGDVKKFKVYVKNPKGNVVKVNFGHGGSSVKGKAMKIRKNNPKARKSFRARHNCDNPGPRHKARYWSCRKW